MENQHRLIKGYRELNEEEIKAMNFAKELEAKVIEFVDRGIRERAVTPDPRWLAIAKTDLQKGFMSLGRAIARPDGY